MENISVDMSTEVKEQSDMFVSDRRLLGLLPMFILVLIIVLRISWTLYKSFGQKTRSAPQRRMYAGSRPRPSLDPQEPSIYVSPSNMPPPPKYDFIAPPSYDEVVSTHYPQYQQPISLPITTALSQSTSTSQDTENRNDTGTRNDPVTRTETVVTVPVTASS